MRISSKFHGIFDYVFSATLASSPWLFGFSQEHVAPQIALAFGAVTAFYSAITNYELSLLRVIPFAAHRFFDLIIGVLLGGASWHFAMGGRPGVIFTILGALLIAVTFLTYRPPNTSTQA